jgi:MFS family permease
LSDLGLDSAQILTQGEYLISVQMIGLLLGGILFGIIGDKRGRLSVLFGSILMYSIANILNGMVVNVNQYAILRFIAGIGLAGELGAGVTLVSELLPKEKRSVATGFIAGFGIFGVVFAFALSRFFDWRTCYYIGGGLGILLLLLRVQVRESILFSQVKQQSIVRGNFLMFFTNKKRFFKYLQCVLMGLPVWYIIGILVTFADQFGKAFGIADIDPAKAIVFLYSAIAFGDFAVGWLSERLRSRRITYFIFASIAIVFCAMYFLQQGGSANTFYLLCAGMGFGAGRTIGCKGVHA